LGKNNSHLRVDVQFHAGYRGAEEPRKVLTDEGEWTVGRILERKRIRDQSTGVTYEEFACLVNRKLAKLSIYPDGRHYLTFLEE
jgi:hypothetical protein